MKKDGADTEYRMLHYWVEKQLGKPKKCETCGTTERLRYHWANVSGEYRREVSDWQRLCVPCHQKKDGFGLKTKRVVKDGIVYCGKGLHRMEGNNLYLHRRPGGTGAFDCRSCKNIGNMEYRRKKVLGGQADE